MLRGLRGNLLSDSVRTFAYDAANRLTSVTSGTLTTTFEYDGLPAPVAHRPGTGQATWPAWRSQDGQLGNRVAQTGDGVTTEYVLGGARSPRSDRRHYGRGRCRVKSWRSTMPGRGCTSCRVISAAGAQ
jgi:YD repeat-containing protein